jgi:hypothetical protein
LPKRIGYIVAEPEIDSECGILGELLVSSAGFSVITVVDPVAGNIESNFFEEALCVGELKVVLPAAVCQI